jgi:hypothetical protein
MTPEAVEAAARADRDAQPLTLGDLKRMKMSGAPGQSPPPRYEIIPVSVLLSQR